MKKTAVLLSLLFLWANIAFGQVHFEPLSWQDALGKARKENKMIFIDVYTTWCTYCKQMDAAVFALPETGAFHNEHFINVKYDAMKADGIAVRKSYTLAGIPAFLYLDCRGMVVKKTVGYQSKEQLLLNSKTALAQFAIASADSLEKQ